MCGLEWRCSGRALRDTYDIEVMTDFRSRLRQTWDWATSWIRYTLRGQKPNSFWAYTRLRFTPKKQLNLLDTAARA